MKKTTFRFITTSLLILVTAATVFTACSRQSTGVTGPGKNDVLTLYGIDPHTLDPAVSGDSTSHQYVTQIFSGLFRLNDEQEPQPDIVKDWRVSADGTTYTFTLREDVTFHDGTPVTAADFKYSWERTCYPSTGSHTAETYLGDIVGVDDVLSGKSTGISGVTVKDDYTLEVTIDAPRASFLYKLTYPTTFVVDKTNVESGKDWYYRPNGTGPFQLTEWSEGERLVLEWNSRYYGDTPGLSTVTFLLWGGIPIVMYENGQIDVTSVPTAYIDRVTDPSEAFYDELTVFPELSFYYLGFDSSKPPFDDKNIRAAFSMAIDREKITRLIFRDMVTPAEGILPPGMPGYNDELDGYGYNPVQARELIAQSAYGSVEALPPITLTTAGLGGILSRDLEAIVDQWKTNLGVEIEVRQLESTRYMYNLAEEKDNLFDIGWIADYPHPENFLSVLFKTNSQYNYAGYSNPAADALLEEAGLELDTEASLELYRQAEQTLVEDAACIPLWFGENYYLIKPYVKGFYLNPLGIVMLDQIRIDKNG